MDAAALYTIGAYIFFVSASLFAASCFVLTCLGELSGKRFKKFFVLSVLFYALSLSCVYQFRASTEAVKDSEIKLESK